MSVIDIIIVVIGVLSIIIYTIFKVRETIKYNKDFKECLQCGMTKEQAKEFCKNKYSKKKKKKQEQTDEIYDK